MLKWLFKKPTSDEQLISDLKTAVNDVRKLSLQANKRGIRIWLKDSYGKKYMRGEDLTWHTASRVTIEEIG